MTHDADASVKLIAEMLKALQMANLAMAKGAGLSYADRREAHEACMAAISKATR